MSFDGMAQENLSKRCTHLLVNSFITLNNIPWKNPAVVVT